MNHERAQELLREIEGAIEASQKALAKGEMVKLEDSLQAKAQEFCNMIATLPPEELMNYKSSLENIMTNLDLLSQEMVKQRDIIKENATKLNSQQQAHSAYKQAESLKDPED